MKNNWVVKIAFKIYLQLLSFSRNLSLFNSNNTQIILDDGKDIERSESFSHLLYRCSL